MVLRKKWPLNGSVQRISYTWIYHVIEIHVMKKLVQKLQIKRMEKSYCLVGGVKCLFEIPI